jgi:hypothetical protein
MVNSKFNLSTNYSIDCIRDGAVVWTINKDNLVVNEGLEYVMDRTFGADDQVEWRIGLLTESNVSPGDTMSIHQYAFVEFMGTTNVNRPIATFVDSGIEFNKYSYTANDVQVMVAATGYLTGAFMTSGIVKGEEVGILYGVAEFPASRSVIPGDALMITVKVTAQG